MNEIAVQTPLTDLLDGVPRDARILHQAGRFESHSIPVGRLCADAAARIRELEAQIAECKPYLKDGETPAQRIKRDHSDTLGLMELLAREKARNEPLVRIDPLARLGKEPCGECHLQPGERCNICGAEKRLGGY